MNPHRTIGRGISNEKSIQKQRRRRRSYPHLQAKICSVQIIALPSSDLLLTSREVDQRIKCSFACMIFRHVSRSMDDHVFALATDPHAINAAPFISHLCAQFSVCRFMLLPNFNEMFSYFFCVSSWWGELYVYNIIRIVGLCPLYSSLSIYVWYFQCFYIKSHVQVMFPGLYMH